MLTYNCTLRPLDLNGPQVAVAELDRIQDRNARILADYRRAGKEQAGSLCGRRRVPEAIARLSAFPTMIYRCLRRAAASCSIAT
jgi:plasmid stabilization system protein ParE